MSLTLCPLCSAVCKDHVPTSPYWICGNCDLWFADPAPPKLFHAAHEGPPEQMSDGDRAINDSLAGWLFDVAMKQKTGPTLDIGAALPVLASRLAKRGCLAYAMEGDTLPDLGGDESLMVVNRVNADFEKIDGYMDGTWSLITFIHAWEHIYRPIEAMKKLRRMIHNSGKLFIRMPDHGVPGYERDMNPGHYSIHPMYYSFTAILQLCVQTESFEVEFSMPMLPGQRDMILAPI